ncbi:hypothetical protein HanPI659440_Chr11g0437721 [Helianthus annuus]|nr:hypothetical protein HanPI659440_Chr11g0437721 [Helianthus annuus]
MRVERVFQMVCVSPTIHYVASGADPSLAQGVRAHLRGKKFSAKFRRKSRPHPLEFFDCTLEIFRTHPLGKKCYQFIF